MACVVAFMTTRMSLRAAGLVALTVATVSVTVAWAAPARTFTFDSAKTEKYDAQGSGIVTFSDGSVPIDQCTSGLRDCDDTLVELKVPGKLTAKVTGGDPTVVDVALDLYAADSTGKVGKQLKQDDQNATLSESVSGEFDPGFYVVRVDYMTGQGAVNMEVSFAPVEPTPVEPGTTPAGTTPTAANAAPKAIIKLAKSYKASALKGIGGTASDDGAVAKVQVGLLLKGKGGKCRQLTASGTFARAKSCSAPTRFLTAAGTSSWSLKLKKKLAKGSYTAFAKATDDKGLTQAKPAKHAFRIR